MKNDRRDFIKYSLGGVSAGILSSTIHGTTYANTSGNKKNVLFIIVEDLKNIMGCYGHPIVKTPNLDRLAEKGVIFDHAYCQYAVCNPSRSSFLTGLRPDTTKILDNKKPWRTHLEGHTTLPALFKNNGYYTVSLGKVFHKRKKDHNDMKAWDICKDFSRTEIGKKGENRNMSKGKIKWCKWLAAEGTDDDQPDGRLAAYTVDILKQKRDNPFFIALGFHKPHDPFYAPKKYFDMYPLNKLKPPVMPENRSPKEDYKIGSPNWHAAMKNFSMQDKKEFMRSYYACTTFTDAQIGRVMDELDRQKLWKDTVVIFVGDHGYNLGEYDWWNKAVLMEDSARIPMIAVVEDETKSNVRCDGLVEMVDLYPTFADLCGLKTPKNLEGISFRKLLSKPDTPWKKAAYTEVKHGSYTGKSVRTKQYRYNEWFKNSKLHSRELFDHENDPKEFRNLAELDKYKKTCLKLSKLLKTGHNELIK